MTDHPRRPSRPPFPAWLAALAGALVLVAACGPTATASPSAPSATGSAPASAPNQPSDGSSPAAAAPCGRDDVAATSTGWGGAAGSRGADVEVENVGAAACQLPSRPAVVVFDANGAVVLQPGPALGGPPPTLDPGSSAAFSFRWSNWCDESVALPLHMAVALVEEAAGIEGLPVTTAADLPPCNGPEQPPLIEATDWAS